MDDFDPMLRAQDACAQRTRIRAPARHGACWLSGLAMLLLACATATQPVSAQDDKKASRERETLRRAQQALKKAEDEKTQLVREKAELEAKAKQANDQLAGAEEAAATARRRAAGLSGELKRAKTQGDERVMAFADLQRKSNELQQQLAEAGARIATLGLAQTEALRTVASRDAQQKQLQATLGQVRKEIGVCEVKNARLFTYGDELLRHYRGKTAMDSVLQAEPLTGLKLVEIENLLEEYRGKLSAERIVRP